MREEEEQSTGRPPAHALGYVLPASAVPPQVCSRVRASGQADALQPRLLCCRDHIGSGRGDSPVPLVGLCVSFWMLPAQRKTIYSLNLVGFFVCCVTDDSFSGESERALKSFWSELENSARFHNKSIVDLADAWGILCCSLFKRLARYLGPNQIFHQLGEDESSALDFFF